MNITYTDAQESEFYIVRLWDDTYFQSAWEDWESPGDNFNFTGDLSRAHQFQLGDELPKYLDYVGETPVETFEEFAKAVEGRIIPIKATITTIKSYEIIK